MIFLHKWLCYDNQPIRFNTWCDRMKVIRNMFRGCLLNVCFYLMQFSLSLPLGFHRSIHPSYSWCSIQALYGLKLPRYGNFIHIYAVISAVHIVAHVPFRGLSLSTQTVDLHKIQLRSHLTLRQPEIKRYPTYIANNNIHIRTCTTATTA